MRLPTVLLVLWYLAGSGAALHAQGMTDRAPRADDVATLDGILDAFYEVVSGPAGEPRDWARDSTLYLADARFTLVQSQGGAWSARTVDHDAYARSAGPSLQQGFFEREIHREVRRFGPIANVFSTYEWRREPQGEVGGRGVNSIELFHDGARWWIAWAMWADETPSNPIPPELLPRR
jgi:hypothetical protein